MYLGESIKTTSGGDIAMLKAKALDFNAAYEQLNRARPDPVKYPAQYRKWTTLKAYGDKTRASVSRITGIVDSVTGVYDSTVSYWKNALGLGVIPLIPVAGMAITGAVIASSIAAMTYFIGSAYEYGKFADASPEVREQLLKQSATSGVKGVLSGVTGIMVIGALIYLAPMLLKMGKK